MANIYLETYGCQMNFADSEIVASILQKEGHTVVSDIEQADYILINTCAIRDNAEQRIRKRLHDLRALQQRHKQLRIGILGCMAERLQSQLMVEEENVSFVVGPDAYRRLPDILTQVRQQGVKTAETELSTTETYSDIEPVRVASNGISAYISIMRGCQNYCAYCVVPYTRGRERSRDPETIVAEARSLFNQGYKEVTLLGQNVNSYRFSQSDGSSVDFPELMHRVAEISPLLRVRFATSHPKDLSDRLLQVMAAHDNICKCIHLPVQSGSDRMLKLMNRHYDSAVRYDYAYMFKFSMRPDTYAAKHLTDDVPDAEKTRRLEEIIALQGQIALENNRKEIGKTFEVLVEGESHRSKEQLFGRNSQNKVIVFDRHNILHGQYVKVRVTDCTAATLKGEVVTSRQ